ncbi:disease resistance protein [Gossypium australe]|uniref:Disease resistance protein n=1 Tax=Gossypium australe TaxID=47621 RepID=A0A5B6VSP5_9ROSI|nr:disease resistance protein [Gossypium australe]
MEECALRIEQNISSIINVKDKVYQQLRFNYDRLKDGGIQNYFLIYALYREDLRILKEQMIRNWVRKGLIKEIGNLEANMENRQSYTKNTSRELLVRKYRNERVKMHDLVIDMAKLITQELYES